MSRALRVVDGNAEKRAVENRQARERAASEAELSEARAQIEAEERAAEAQAQRKLDTVAMNDAITFVASLPERLWPELQRLLELDIRVADVVDAIADRIVDAEDAFARATSLGEALECPHVVQRQVRRPTLAQAALLARVAVARDRRARRSDLVDGWICAEVEPHHTSPQKTEYAAAVAVVSTLEKSHG